MFEQQRDDTAVSENAPEWFKMKNLVAFQKKLDAGEVNARRKKEKRKRESNQKISLYFCFLFLFVLPFNLL